MQRKIELSMKDRFEIGDLFARYGRLVDSGDADGYAALFTSDGSFSRTNPLTEGSGSGLPPAGFHGREPLRQLVLDLAVQFRGKMRHQLTDVFFEADGTPETAKGICYGLITDWRDGAGKISMHATYRMSIVKTHQGWRFRDVTIERLPSD